MNGNYQINYQPSRVENLQKLCALVFELFGITGMEPETITLPDGRVLKWNAFLADKFAAEGHISEEEFIKMSME
jgi:hypothetical protein